MAVDLRTQVGSLTLSSPVLTAAGTSGYGAELGAYGPLDALGAVVVKSLAAYPWPGNAPPRVAPLSDGSMINSVGLAGPGIERWKRDYLPGLIKTGATVVASIWGRRVEEFAEAATALRSVEGIAALEVNISCPNLEDRTRLFSNSPEQTAAVIDACAVAQLPIWAKLGPMTPELVAVAGAALTAGAQTLVLTNTLIGLSLTYASGRAVLGGGGGGVSGPALQTVALRAVSECRSAYPNAGIVGVGGVANGRHALAFVRAGANAVGVGTATFAHPKAPWRIAKDLERTCRTLGVASIKEVMGK